MNHQEDIESMDILMSFLNGCLIVFMLFYLKDRYQKNGNRLGK